MLTQRVYEVELYLRHVLNDHDNEIVHKQTVNQHEETLNSNNPYRRSRC